MKHRQLPEKYKEGFLAKMDQRTELWGRLTAAYEEVLTDMGDPAKLTRARKALAERFCFAQFFLQGLEREIAEAADKDKKKALRLFAKWSMAVNTLVGLARSAGMLSKNGKPVMNLREYARSQRYHERKDSM